MNLTKKMFFKYLMILFDVTAVICIIYVGLAFDRFETDLHSSSYKESINEPDTLTIIYNPDCPRCRSVLPRLFLAHAFDSGNEHILEAHKLTSDQKTNLGENLTPTFIYKGEVLETTNYSKINKFWNRSHHSWLHSINRK